MNSYHEVVIKPIGEVAQFLKKLIPVNIPETYEINPIFANIASEEDIRSGVIVFRDFLYLFFDRLTSEGQLYAKPSKKPSDMADYPFIHNLANLLIEMGYYGKLAESGHLLVTSELPSFTASMDGAGKIKKPKVSSSNAIGCLQFLALCGFTFTGVDLKKKTLNVSKTQLLEVSYPKDPILLIGLKVMSIADIELRTRRYWNDNHLLRCDYRLIKAESTEIGEILKDFLHPLPEAVQDFALKLHQRYVDKGMTCSIRILGDINFAYADIRRVRRELSPTDIYSLSVWQFSISLKNGYCIFVRPKRTDQYADVIQKFPSILQEKIAKGYGCNRKRNEPCQGGCQGICIPLDDTILSMAKDIEVWLDHEVAR